LTRKPFIILIDINNRILKYYHFYSLENFVITAQQAGSSGVESLKKANSLDKPI